MRILFAALAGILFTTAPSFAEAPVDAQAQIQSTAQMLRQRCNGECLKAAQDCRAGKEAAPEVCDTRAILCLVACPSCAGQYPVCRKDQPEGGAGSQLSIMRCTAQVMECRAEARKKAETHGPITFSGGDGKTQASAVVITGARNSPEGVVAELYWAWRNRPELTKTGQALINRDGRRYDLIRNKSPDGAQVELYFDITDFFGKM